MVRVPFPLPSSPVEVLVCDTLDVHLASNLHLAPSVDSSTLPRARRKKRRESAEESAQLEKEKEKRREKRRGEKRCLLAVLAQGRERRRERAERGSVVMLTIPDLTSRVESSQQGTKPESSRVEESTPE